MENGTQEKEKRRQARTFVLILFAALALAAGGLLAPNKARAQCLCNCNNAAVGCACSFVGHIFIQAMVAAQHVTTRAHFLAEMEKHKDWWANGFFTDILSPAVQRMIQQLITVGMQQVASIGMMLDAKHQQETLRLFDRKKAEAHKDYFPSAEMCTIGTAARGLATADRNAQATAGLLARHSLGRQLGNLNVAASENVYLDRQARLRQFKSRYCDPDDNNMGLGSVCAAGAGAGAVNRDIDYSRTISQARTLDVNFMDGALTGDEQDVVALSSYLYAHTIPARPTEALLENIANQDDYLDWRSVVAKRSVAENSFNAIVGMKAAGNGSAAGNAQYVQAVLTQLGVSPAEAQGMISDSPSYYALMEVLGQKIYQNPQFYTNLYDKPANVERKDVAMQAIGLMLDRDSYRSELRYESMLSVLLEMEIMKYQESVQDRLNVMTERSKAN